MDSMNWQDEVHTLAVSLLASTEARREMAAKIEVLTIQLEMAKQSMQDVLEENRQLRRALQEEREERDKRLSLKVAMMK